MAESACIAFGYVRSPKDRCWVIELQHGEHLGLFHMDCYVMVEYRRV